MGFPNLNPEKARTIFWYYTRKKLERYISTSNQYYQGSYFLNQSKGVSGNNQDIDGILKQNK